MAQTASVRLTLSNIATEEDVNNLREDLTAMEERIMSALSDAIAALRATVENLSIAQSPEKVAELEAAVQREREANEALVAQALSVQTAEELEDTLQAEELAAAKAANDALIAEMTGAAGELTGITEQLAAVGTAVEEAPDEQPIGEVPVEAPAETAPVEAPAETAPVEETPAETAPVEETPAETPAETAPTEEPANPTPDPSSPATPDAEASPDGTPAPDAGPAPATGGPTDAAGNPIEGPRL